MERHKAVPAIYLIMERNSSVLLMRRFNTGYQDGNYSVPSGHVEVGESPRQAMQRESREEIGIEVRSEDLDLVTTMYRAKRDETGERVDFFFKTKRWIGEPQNKEEDKCDHLEWFPLNKLPSNMVPHVKIALDCYRDNINYTEVGF